MLYAFRSASLIASARFSAACEAASPESIFARNAATF
jgi:hypothetical protein